MTITGTVSSRSTLQPGLDHAISEVDEKHIHHRREYHVIRQMAAQHEVKALEQRFRVVGRWLIRGEKVTGKECVVPYDAGHTMSPGRLCNDENLVIAPEGESQLILTALSET